MSSNRSRNISRKINNQNRDYIRNAVVEAPKLVSGLQIKAEQNNSFLIINFLETLNNLEENSLLGSFILPNKMVREIHKNFDKYLKELDNENE